MLLEIFIFLVDIADINFFYLDLYVSPKKTQR